jgi:hypothetical protein
MIALIWNVLCQIWSGATIKIGAIATVLNGTLVKSDYISKQIAGFDPTILVAISGGLTIIMLILKIIVIIKKEFIKKE